MKAGVAGTFLKWLSDRKPGQAYVVATANNVKNIPPEYLRSERWDAMFYLDLPTPAERGAIWALWGKRFGQVKDPDDDLRRYHPAGVADDQWTGAEIRACCRTAAMMGCSLAEASAYVVPVARSMREQIDEMRTWAKDRCVAATTPPALAAAGGRRIMQ